MLTGLARIVRKPPQSNKNQYLRKYDFTVSPPHGHDIFYLLYRKFNLARLVPSLPRVLKIPNHAGLCPSRLISGHGVPGVPANLLYGLRMADGGINMV